MIINRVLRWIPLSKRDCGSFVRFVSSEVDVIRDSIHHMFEQRSINHQSIDIYFEKYKEKMNTDHCAYLMFRAGRKSYAIQNKYIKLIAETIEKESSKSVTDLQIGQLLYGLRMHYENPAVMKYVHVVNGLIHDDLELNNRYISMALSGLRGLSSTSTPVRTLCHTLSTKLLKTDDNFIIADWFNALYGLQGMRSEQGEAIGLLTAVVARRPKTAHNIRGRGTAMCFLGLRGMSSSHPAVRAVIRSMTEFLEEIYPVTLEEIAIGNIFFSMQRFDSAHQEVRNLLTVVSRHATHVTKPLTGLTVRYHIRINHNSISLIPLLPCHIRLALYFTDFSKCRLNMKRCDRFLGLSILEWCL